MHFPTAKTLGGLKQRMGGTVPPHTSIAWGEQFPLTPVLVWGRHVVRTEKSPHPGIKPGLQESESDAGLIEPNRFGTCSLDDVKFVTITQRYGEKNTGI